MFEMVLVLWLNCFLGMMRPLAMASVGKGEMTFAAGKSTIAGEEGALPGICQSPVVDEAMIPDIKIATDVEKDSGAESPPKTYQKFLCNFKTMKCKRTTVAKKKVTTCVLQK